ncbi:MAG: TolC family protein [Bacteroidales bacterium]|nr:TolC family protein [Bacteroidales bacterium]
MTTFGNKGLSPGRPSDSRLRLKAAPAVLALLLCAALRGQAPSASPSSVTWQLDSCIRYALGHNLDLRVQDIEIADRRALLLRSSLGMLPSFNAVATTDFNWGRSVDARELTINRDKLTRATGLSLQGSWEIFGGFARQYGRLAAKEAVREADADRRRLSEALAVDVTRSYLQLLLSREMLSLARENEETIARQCARTRTLVEAGGQPKSALSEMEAQVAAEHARVVEADGNVRTCTLQLMQLMNLPPGDGQFIVGEAFGTEGEEVPPLPDYWPDTEIEAMAQRDPRIDGARSRVEMTRHQASATAGAAFPRISVTASYGTFFSSTSDDKPARQLDDNRNPSLSLNLTIPIFNYGETAINIRRSRLAVEKARLAHELMQIQVGDEIRSALIEAGNCYQRYRAAREMLDATASALAVTEAKYNLGASTALDYIVARNNHFKAVSDLLQAKWQYLFQLRLLDHYRR